MRGRFNTELKNITVNGKYIHCSKCKEACCTPRQGGESEKEGQSNS